MTQSPMQHLTRVLRQNGLIRFIEHFAELFPTSHLKDLAVEQIGPDRVIQVQGRKSSTSAATAFWGLDQDPRVQEALRRGIDNWGTHNGASRAFASVAANMLAEQSWPMAPGAGHA